LGIADLPTQRVRRSKRQPYVFNIMVVGESGLGKSTFLNSLFDTDLIQPGVTRHLASSKGVTVRPQTFEVEEKGVTLHLTVIDTPGFGDQLDRKDNHEPILQYIEQQYDRYFQAERGNALRRNIPDTRVHALLYFIAPSGTKGLKELDVDFLQRLCLRVNIIPVIARADALTVEEKSAFKKQILREFEAHDIRVYPAHHTDDRELMQEFERYMPFAVIGSNEMIQVKGKAVRGRRYRWGEIDIADPACSDFIHLRSLLVGTHCQDLIEVTSAVHYAAYRAQAIRSVGRPESFLACDEAYETRVDNAKRLLADEMARKEDEMRQMFVARVREKESSLREREEALNAKRQAMMDELERLRRAVEQEDQLINEMVLQQSGGTPSPQGARRYR
ncbi:hypothetical protein CXG81DRAFT_12904, partial [Caulochytrium protostelioides]